MASLKYLFCLCLIIAPTTQAQNVTVSTNKVSIETGKNASVTCSPGGSPLPKVQWKKHAGKFGKGTKQVDNALILSDVEWSDRGYYLCYGILDGKTIAEDHVKVEVKEVEQASPTASIIQRALRIKRGQNGTVDCIPAGRPLPRVQWGKGIGQFSARVRQQGTKLIITNAQISDAGDYVCRAIRESTTVWSDYVRVEVEDYTPPPPPPTTQAPSQLEGRDPIVTVTSRQLRIPRGGSGRVDCNPSGFPLPGVQWIKDDGQFSSRTRQAGNSLIFSGVGETDGGNYVCNGLVENTPVWTEYVQVIIDPYVPQPTQGNPRVSVRDPVVRIARGGSARVECIPEGSPLPTVQWTKENSRFRHGVRQEQNYLIITNAQDYDGGNYVCTALVQGTPTTTAYLRVDIEDVPQPTQGNPRVSVRDPVVRIARGGSARVECIPEGSPLPTVQWTKENSRFRHGVRQEKNYLIITNAQDYDGGNYVCTALVQGTPTTTAYLRVDIEDVEPPTQAPPRPENPTVAVSVNQVRILQGRNGRVDCTPRGSPLPTVQWAKGEGRFSSRTRQAGNSLVITGAQESDGGNYACNGIVESTAVWTDYVQVVIVTSAVAEPYRSGQLPKPQNFTTVEGHEFIISCDFETGDDEQVVTWSRRDRRPLPRNVEQRDREIIFHRATKENTGEYICRVTGGGYLLRQLFASVVVQTRPRAAQTSQGTPRVRVNDPLLRIARGGSGRVECIPEGYPLPTVQWTKENSRFRDGVRQEGNYLIITNAQDSDVDNYVCTALVQGTPLNNAYLQVSVEDVPQTSQDTPRVRVNDPLLRIARGGSGRVECIPEGYPLPTVQWTKENSRFRDGVRQEGNYLIITNAQDSDVANYVCTALVQGTPLNNAYIQVSVEDVPETSQGTPRVRVNDPLLRIVRGGSGKVECIPEGFPLPTVQWTKENSRFRDGVAQEGNFLIITNAQDSDVANYVCTALVQGTPLNNAYLQVSVEDVPETSQGTPRVRVNDPQLRIVRGGSGKVECIPEGFPLPTVQWTKENSRFRDGVAQEGNFLIITNAQDSDVANYVCTALVQGTPLKNAYVQVSVEDVPQTSQGTPRVRVNDPLLRITRGGSGRVECIPEGYPLPTVQWTKENSRFRDGVRQEGNYLIITNAEDSDVANYVCTALVQGTPLNNAYLQVSVEDVPETSQGTPRVRVNDPLLRIARGGSGKVECIPEGLPLPTVQWTKENSRFRDGVAQEGNFLIITNAQDSDVANYVCTALVQGTPLNNAYVQVSVEDVPQTSQGTPWVRVNNPLLRITRGGSGRVECIPEGYPLPTVQWTKENSRFRDGVRQEGNYLIITNAEDSDVANYVCTALVQGTPLNNAYLQVSVEDMPETSQGTPRVRVNDPLLRIARGGSGKVECIPEGLPLPTVQWTKENSRFRDGVAQEGNFLIITNAQDSDVANYVCTALVQGTPLNNAYLQVSVEDVPQTSQGTPWVRVNDPLLRLTRGGSGRVECIPEGYPLPTVQWTKENSRFRDGVRQEGNYLIITNAEDSDVANYVCTALVQGTPLNNAYLQVSVEDMPETSQGTPRVRVNDPLLRIARGGSGKVECIPEGLPLPTVQWTKENSRFRDGVRQEGNYLIITNAQDSDVANYVCTALVQGTPLNNAYLQVSVEDVPETSQGTPRVRVNDPLLRIARGGSGKVECIPEGLPLPTVQWTKENSRFRDGVAQEGNFLIITNAQDSDVANYVCTALVQGTPLNNAYVQVSVEDPPRSQEPPRVKVSEPKLKLRKGGSGRVECVPEGEPLPTVQWTKESSRFRDGVSQEGNELVIMDAQESDGGNYVCTALVDGSALTTDYLQVEIESGKVVTDNAICQLPLKSSWCWGIRWYYDISEHRCATFNWGGCDGNENNFDSEEACNLACGGV